MTASVACGWAGAVMQKPLEKLTDQLLKKPTNRSKNRPTNHPKNKDSYKARFEQHFPLKLNLSSPSPLVKEPLAVKMKRFE